MKAKKNRLQKTELISKIVMHVLFVICALLIAATPILMGNSDIINAALGIETSQGSSYSGDMYFDTAFKNKSIADVHEASLDIIEETMKEGAVLLKNDNDALPLSQGDDVTLYGMGSYATVYGGQGSGGVEAGDVSDCISMFDGLTAAGLNVNSELYNYYSAQNISTVMGASDFRGGATQAAEYQVRDIAWNSLPSSKENIAEAGIMVLSRNSGEAEDMYMDVTLEDGRRVVVKRNNHNNASASIGDSLELSANEKTVLAGMRQLKADGKISKIIVIMNTASALQAEFLDDPAYGIDACMWVGTIGSSGSKAIGKLLTGEYNPSGKASDTIWANSKYNPVYYNFGSIGYENMNVLSNNYFATDGYQNHRYYVAYQEGIYNGYRYTETRYEDYVTGRDGVGEFDYEAAVSYPFGYGLSYSDFTYSNMKVSYDSKNDEYTVTVKVNNTSGRDGKEAVQLYLQKPYTAADIENGVEKSAVELVGFDKVEVKAHDDATATIKVKGKYFAAYDANEEETYVIGSTDAKDDYLLTVARDSHEAANNILQYKKDKGFAVDESKMTSHADRGLGDKSLVWNKHFAYDALTYSTNEFIKEQNAKFVPQYDDQLANYGVNQITNQFDDTDFQKANLFSAAEQGQPYMTRSNWTGTFGKRITLTATADLRDAQKNPVVEKDDIAYPDYEVQGFYESADDFDEIKLIYLRGKDYDDPLWNTLLDRMSYDDMCVLLQTGLRVTNAVESIAAPSTSQQNGGLAPNHARNYSELIKQSGFRGFVDIYDSENRASRPPVFACNGIVASTYNTEFIQRLGKQTAEEAAWAGYNGIYGLGVNIHRGQYCGRTFEYYSEDGFLTGVAAGYEAVGLHEMGVFVLMKHAVLNDQETHRAGLNVWANEQSIREIYSRAIELAVEIDREYTPCSVLGVMTGMNRLGAKWTGGQGFCNTVLRAEYGMRGYVISDYNSSRPYMSPIQGVLYGNDLPDGNPAGNRSGYDYDNNDIRFTEYAEGYGELAWAMRTASKNILYTVVNSNAMNGVTGDSSFRNTTPAWQKAAPVLERVTIALFAWAAVLFVAVVVLNAVIAAGKKQLGANATVAEDDANGKDSASAEQEIPDTINCPHCGERLPANSKFCGKCGNPLN